jgi:hypothetical protein
VPRKIAQMESWPGRTVVQRGERYLIEGIGKKLV